MEVVLSITESCFRKANFKIRLSIDRERVMFTMIISVVVLPFTGTVCRIRHLSRTLVGRKRTVCPIGNSFVMNTVVIKSSDRYEERSFDNELS